MDLTVPGAAASELAPAFLLLAVTLGLSGIFVALHRRHAKPYFAWWAVAWAIYALRLGAICAFILTERAAWLYWHQVTTGWTALALLWAALVFSRQRRWHTGYAALLLFPPLWSWIAIYRMDDFLSAAGPAVAFLSAASLLTAWAFLRHHRQVGSPSARFLGIAFLLWGLHHLDYPFLRARGVWNPWGYYLDALLALAVGAGILLLVQEDLIRGLRALSEISAELQENPEEGDAGRNLLRPALSLPGVRGTALAVLTGTGDFRCTHATGACEPWEGDRIPIRLAEELERARSSGEPGVVMASEGTGSDGSAPIYASVLPVFIREEPHGALVIVGEARDPFAALDRTVLVALGHQVGAALERLELYGRLEERTADLEHLAERMVHQHEEERRHLSRELHDETAQLLAAVNLQLGAIAESADPKIAERIAGARGLVGEGIQSIRGLTDRLRPTVLDDLGLVPAMRALCDAVTERSGLPIRMESPADLSGASDATELAAFRTLQEALANVVRHAEASSVEVEVRAREDGLVLIVRDDGRGMEAAGRDRRAGPGGPAGLAGLRERIAGLGGRLTVGSAPRGGTEVRAEIPVDGSRGTPTPRIEAGST